MKRIILFSMLFALVGLSFAAKKKTVTPASNATPEVSAPANTFVASRSETKGAGRAMRRSDAGYPALFI